MIASDRGRAPALRALGPTLNPFGRELAGAVAAAAAAAPGQAGPQDPRHRARPV